MTNDEKFQKVFGFYATEIWAKALQAEYEDYEHVMLVDIKEPLKERAMIIKEWIKKDEVMDIIKGLPQDLWEEYIYMLKGVWCDEDMHTDYCPNCGADMRGETE